MQLQKKYNNPLIAFAISQMKILVENHEQNPLIAAEIIANLSDEPEVEDLILAEEGFMLDDIALAIKTSAYEQTLLEKYENPLARQFESQMQIAILHSPTAAMMSSVRAISNAILYVFAQMEEQGKKGVLEKFVKDLTSGKNPTGFGSQPQEITLDTVKQILEANRPEDLNQILFIHFLFAQKEMRAVPETIHAPNKRMPTGRLLEIIKKYNNGEYRDHPQAFFDEMNFDKLRLVSDVEIYNSHLFTAEPDRGRDGKLADKFSSRMGLLLEHQHQGDLPADRSHWTPDAQYQKANLDSIYVRDLIENDAVYASGPSGMTSLFLGIMEMYGNFSTVQEKQNYFAAVSAYMVSGGLHSLHEVLGPAQYGLGLIPGYRVTAPDHGVIAAPPNFHQFYQQQMELDPDFATRYDAGWEKLMTVYAQERHLHIHKPIERFNPDSMVQLVAAHQIETASVAVINSKNAADRMINVLDKALKHYSIDFADTSEGDEAIRVLDQIKKEDKLSSVMNHFKAYFDALVEAKGSKAKNNTFIGFLFNQLKKDEQLISFINNHNQPKSVLKLDPNLDYIAPNLSDKREEALQAFRAMNICEPQMDPPTEQRVSSIRDKLQALRSQHLDPEVPKFDAGVT